MTITEVKTADLIGPALDWAVAQIESETEHVQFSALPSSQHYYAPSRKWAQGGPLIERGAINIYQFDLDEEGQPNPGWCAYKFNSENYKGPTPLVAAMRCHVASKLGDTVQVPKELLP